MALPFHFQSFGPQEKLLHVASNPNAAMFAYDRLGVCAFAAEVQMQRIWIAHAASATASFSKEGASFQEMMEHVNAGKEKLKPLLSEIHFYFVAWANCGNMLRVLTGFPEFLESKKIFDSVRKHFEHYAAARNSFEHYHDRLPGQSEEGKVREVVQGQGASPSRIYFGVDGGKYRHSDMVWDITPASLTLLKGSISRVKESLHTEIEILLQKRFGSSPPRGAA